MMLSGKVEVWWNINPLSSSLTGRENALALWERAKHTLSLITFG